MGAIIAKGPAKLKTAVKGSRKQAGGAWPPGWWSHMGRLTNWNRENVNTHTHIVTGHMPPQNGALIWSLLITNYLWYWRTHHTMNRKGAFSILGETDDGKSGRRATRKSLRGGNPGPILLWDRISPGESPHEKKARLVGVFFSVVVLYFLMHSEKVTKLYHKCQGQ